jgi:hypothetical protein
MLKVYELDQSLCGETRYFSVTTETPRNLLKLLSRSRGHDGRRSYWNVSQLNKIHILSHIPIRSILISSHLRHRLPNNLLFISVKPPETSHSHRLPPF